MKDRSEDLLKTPLTLGESRPRGNITWSELKSSHQIPKWSNKPRKAFTLALNKPQAEELLLALSKDQSSLEDEDYSDLVEQLTTITKE